MIGLTILLALFLISLYECRICSDTSNLTVMDGEKVVFSVDKSTQQTTAVELHADKCNCKSVQSTEIAELQAMVAKLNTTLTALSSATPTTTKTTTTTTTATTPKPGSTSGDLTTALSRIATLETTVATLQSKIAALESNSTASASVVFVRNTAGGLTVTVTCPTGVVVNCINRSTYVRCLSGAC
jgi:outer membrane murein-binding lipoprotein Lpp